jgi:O-methyltransferase
MRGLYRVIRSGLARECKLARVRPVYKRFRGFTMIPPDIYLENLLLAERVRDVPGCIVECGVWRGGMIAGMATVLGPDRDYFLFDSFEGLPPAKEIDGEAALRWQKKTDSPEYYDNCTAPIESAREAMALAGAPSYQVLKGWFSESLPAFRLNSPIALLRLDADWYDSTIICLETLFDRVSTGGLIILDDYFSWDGCSRALHDFLSSRSYVERIQTSIGAVCFLQKCGTPVLRA